MELLALAVVAAIVAYGCGRFPKFQRARMAARVQQQLTNLLPERFVIFDLETTGLDPHKHEIIEIAAIRANRDSENHDTFRAFVKPKRKIPKKITELTGITQALVDADGQPIDSVLRQFQEFIGEHLLVAYNANFDLAFLNAAAISTGIEFRNDVSCALKMARRAWPGRRSYKLVDIAGDGGLNTSDSHRALGDCQRTLIVFTGAVSLLGKIR